MTDNSDIAGETRLAPNTLAFIALANEYCNAVENATAMERDDFIAAMLRLLPRIYISATDIANILAGDPDTYIQESLTEDYYDAMRRSLESVFGEDDTYLDTFEEEMKYSDTPIAASISEQLADIFQVMYNYLEVVRDAPDSLITDATAGIRQDFEQYWSRQLCNALRAINALRYA